MKTEIGRREEIISKAATLFSKKGYAATSMRDIAETLGMEAASLYSHIGSKEEILQEICFTMADRLLLGMDEVNDIYFNAAEKLRMAVQLHVKTLTENLGYAATFLYDWKQLSEPHLSQFIQLRDRYEAGFAQIVIDGENENLFEEVDKKFAVLNILSSINWIVEWYKPEGSMAPEEIANKITDFILTGLKKNA